MNSGLTFAKSLNLHPGIALSAAQIAALTSDMVWLVEQTITQPDGSQQAGTCLWSMRACARATWTGRVHS